MNPYHHHTSVQPRSGHMCCQYSGYHRCQSSCDCPRSMSWNPITIWANMMGGYVASLSAGLDAFMKVCSGGGYCAGRYGYCGRCDSDYCRCEDYCFRCLEPLPKGVSGPSTTKEPTAEDFKKFLGSIKNMVNGIKKALKESPEFVPEMVRDINEIGEMIENSVPKGKKTKGQT